jgi:ankyrin repeat protein
MPSSKSQLTSEEKLILENDKKFVEAVREANENQPEGDSSALFVDSISINLIFYWAGLSRPDASAHLKQAILSGGDVNERDVNGFTALHYAAENGCVENAKVLLENGADTSAKSISGKTAAETARQAGHSLLADLLSANAAGDEKKGWWKFW